MKLHLGCGERYFPGYINLDFPLVEHSVQRKSVADQFANLLDLKYAPRTIDEVRLHHVFEHFSRPHACARLSGWNSWLKPGGVLHIEVPDFEETAKAVLSSFASNQAQAVGLRHIFGSQEAHRAYHLEGYTASRLKNYVERFGFEVKAVRQEKYLDTYNLEVIAGKKTSATKDEFRRIARSYLEGFLVADVESERSLLEIWMKDFEAQLNKSFA